MDLKLFQIDAFTSKLFGGNPAAVLPLDSWLPDATLQAIAMENNLAETAFFIPHKGVSADFDLRWFTPTLEMDLCGHATLAAAHVLSRHLGHRAECIRFMSKSGMLPVAVQSDMLTLDFPARPGKPIPLTPQISDALGALPVEALAARDMLVVFENESIVRDLVPDMAKLSLLDTFAVIVTAPGDKCDFVSRFFAPRAGVPEDPVTGSAHCTLIPYWTDRLGRNELRARQVSARGGELFCRHVGDRVHIGGRCVTYLEGTIDTGPQ